MTSGAVSSRILVIQHDPTCPPARFAGWLADTGVDLDVIEAWHADIPSIDGYAGLLVLGGPMDADADREHRWLPVARQRFRDAAADAVPALGICLGHQLAALAFGGRVGRNPSGWVLGDRLPVWSCDEDPLFAPLLAERPDAAAYHWNQDVISELPPGAVVLASSCGVPEVVRFTATVWGVQFHPEVSEDLIDLWAAAETATVLECGLAREDLSTDSAPWQILAAQFAALVASASTHERLSSAAR